MDSIETIETQVTQVMLLDAWLNADFEVIAEDLIANAAHSIRLLNKAGAIYSEAINDEYLSEETRRQCSFDLVEVWERRATIQAAIARYVRSIMAFEGQTIEATRPEFFRVSGELVMAVIKALPVEDEEMAQEAIEMEAALARKYEEIKTASQGEIDS